jgi:ElaB/YqjD/DUF883 family membrane-anchored ribosome-binding protein
MAFRSSTSSMTEDANAQLARLRDQVDTLMRERVSPALSDMADRAENAMANVSDTVRDQAEMVSGRVRERPLVAILIAAAVGWAIGRMMR